VLGVMEVADDGFWELRYRLSWPGLPTTNFHVFLQKRDHFILRVGTDPQREATLRTNYDKKEEFLECCQWLFDSLKDFYNWTPERMVSGERRSIGFF
jgi:hypothetical protein